MGTSPTLWEPDRHETLTDAAWDPAAARAGIAEITADAERAYVEATLWPPHPRDVEGEDAAPWTSLYVGAAGVALALATLGGTARDWRREAARFVEVYRATPEGGEWMPSLMIGEVGILAVAGTDDDRMHALITGNIYHPSGEMLWGAAGTMAPALFRYEATGEARWRDLFVANANALLASMAYDAAADAWLWTQEIHGEAQTLVGAAHGFAGNVHALLRGAALLSDAQRALIEERAAHTLRSLAVRDGAAVSWKPQVRAPREKMLLQWCHGAPGMILGLARLPRSAQTDALLVAGAEAIWLAGPLAKGAGLCHGTAGNGWAMLAIHERTGDERWLERARRFAMHALGQVRAARREHGRGRYALWTGDVGVALFVRACERGVAGELPGIGYC